MTYKEAQPFLKEGMEIKCVKSTCCPTAQGLVGKIISMDSLSVNVRWPGHGHEPGTSFPEDEELDILKNSDGSPWVDPRKEPEFKVGSRVRGIAADIKGTEGIIEYMDESVKHVRITKLGEQIWYPGSNSQWKIGGLLTHANWNGCLELLPPEESPEKEEIVGRWVVTINEEVAKRTLFKKKGLFMNVVQQLKDLALSDTDRILRKHGLEDEHGDMTESSTDLMDDEILEERWKTRREAIAADLAKIDAEK